MTTFVTVTVTVIVTVIVVVIVIFFASFPSPLSILLVFASRFSTAEKFKLLGECILVAFDEFVHNHFLYFIVVGCPWKEVIDYGF